MNAIARLADPDRPDARSARAGLGDFATTFSQSRTRWSGVTGVLTELLCRDGFEAEFDADDARLIVMLDEIGGRVELRRSPEAPAPARARGARLPLSLVPAGMAVRGSSREVRFVRHLVLSLDLEELERMQEMPIALPGGFPTRLMFADPSLLRLAELFAEATEQENADALYGDSLSLALLACLLKPDAAAPPKPQRGLLPWQLRAAIAFMEDNLGADVRLQSIAQRVRLSSSYFSRGFRESTGLAPHQWLVKARLDRAQHMMLDTTLPLSDVALAVGFCDQAHFTRSFSKSVGSSPGAWRRLHSQPRTVAVPAVFRRDPGARLSPSA